MSDKARELLQRVLDAWDGIREQHLTMEMEDIRAYLAEPEKKQKPLSKDDLHEGYITTIKEEPWTHRKAFAYGIRFAEAHHGITCIENSENYTNDCELVKKTFIRLTEVEVLALINRDIHGYSLICAVENQLAEKNK